MTFRVGQKVVCINDKPVPGFKFRPGTKPTEGTIYTIAAVRPGAYGNYESVDLVELHSRVGYRASRFRPVVERKTSIEIFTKMLKPSKVNA